jgi:tetratricopeptide (TPR) repeat protein
MSVLDTEPLTPAEIHLLSRHLEQHGVPQGGLGYDGLTGLFQILAGACEPVTPMDWLPVVFPGGFPEEMIPTVMPLLMRLHRQITTEMLHGDPDLPAHMRLQMPPEVNFQPDSPLYQWSHGVALGFALCDAQWRSLTATFNSNADALLDEAHSLLTFFIDEARARETAAKMGTLPFEIFVAMMYSDLSPVIKDFGELGRRLQALKMPSENVVDAPLISDPNASPATRAADQLVDRGWDITDVPHARALARQALRKDPDHVPARLLLADLEKSKPARVTLLKQAVDIAERQLGPDFFAQHQGAFWQPTSRLFMDALQLLGECYQSIHQNDNAIATFQRLLTLNPADHQGVRYSLLIAYLTLHRHDEAEQLLAQFDGEDSTFFLFSHALLAWIREGDTPASRARRDRANQANRYVARALAGRIKIPRHPLPHHLPGDKNEAVLYAHGNKLVWRQHDGAIPWLLKGNQ